jgi:hypothetical protein
LYNEVYKVKQEIKSLKKYKNKKEYNEKFFDLLDDKTSNISKLIYYMNRLIEINAR